MQDVIEKNKQNKSDEISSLVLDRIAVEQEKYLSGEVSLTKAEIFRRHLIEFETRFRLYVGDENYLDEVVLLLQTVGVKTNKNEVAMLLSKTAKEIGFDRKTKKLNKVKK